MLTLVLAESELEVVPYGQRTHPSVAKAAKAKGKRPGRVLLDASLHHTLLKDLREGERRGRPDLVHFFLLLGLDSVLNRRGGLRLFVHTRNDELITVAPETRIMRNYPRFVGLVEALFRNKATPKDNPLLTLEDGWTLERVLKEHAKGPTVAFSETGTPVLPAAFLREKARGDDLTCVLGGFPHGDYHADVGSLADEVVSLYPEPLSVWTVEMEILAHWEAETGVFG